MFATFFYVLQTLFPFHYTYVADEEAADACVDPEHVAIVLEEVEQVGDGGGYPAAALVVVLVEGFWRIGLGVGGGHVADEVALLDDEGAEPSVLALVVLHVVVGLVGLGHVDGQDVVLEEGGAAQQ